MFSTFQQKQNSFVFKVLSLFICFSFSFMTVCPSYVAAQVVPHFLNLPAPGTMVQPTAGYVPALIKGITIDPDNPLKFDFIVSKGEKDFSETEFKDESLRLIKYFLASLTVPEENMWVNLSPYEKERIIPENFGKTEMGMDLLAQDYMLKQLTASLMYPEQDLGKEFWKRVHKKAKEQFGTTDIPVDTFNKIWIVPKDAVVFEKDNSAYVIENRLEVLMEADYVARSEGRESNSSVQDIDEQIIREIIIPEIEKEVNEGETFANLRQIYQSLILATWFKLNLRESLLGQVYVDREKTAGVDTDVPQAKEKIYQQYLEAFHKGVYNYIKEDVDEVSGQSIPRKYFSGGASTTGRDGRSLSERVDSSQLGVNDLNNPGVRRVVVKALEDDINENAKITVHVLEDTGERAQGVVNVSNEMMFARASLIDPASLSREGKETQIKHIQSVIAFVSDSDNIPDGVVREHELAKWKRALDFNQQALSKQQRRADASMLSGFVDYVSRSLQMQPQKVWQAVSRTVESREIHWINFSGNVSLDNQMGKELKRVLGKLAATQDRELQDPFFPLVQLVQQRMNQEKEIGQVVIETLVSARGRIARFSSDQAQNFTDLYIGNVWESMDLDSFATRLTAQLRETGIKKANIVDMLRAEASEEGGENPFAEAVSEIHDLGTELDPLKMFVLPEKEAGDASLLAEGVSSDAGMLSDNTREVLQSVAPQVLADVDADLFTAEQINAVNVVIDAGQQHAIKLAWEAAGSDVAKKKEFLDQIAMRNQTYPIGLTGYAKTHREKLEAKKAGKNPYAGLRPNLAQRVDNTQLDAKYWEAMDNGIKAAGDLVVMLAQGGVGDRLAWKSKRSIKTDLPFDVVLDMSYMETFAREILALQDEANRRRGTDNIRIPYIQMVSGQTEGGLRAYLEENGSFGMDGTTFINVRGGERAVYDANLGKVVIRAKDGETREMGQIVLFRQEDVFAANNWEGKWAMDPKNPHLVMEKGHNHGDLNLLMEMSGLAKAFKDAGKKHIMYHQDTNAETFRAAIPALGNMVEMKKKLNIIVVPIKPGEKAGVIVLMKDPETGRSFIRNVEYSDRDQMFNDPEIKDYLEEQGLSSADFTDGNINVFVMDLEEYARILDENNGLLGDEIVNPKADTLVSRLEAMVQDAYINFGVDDIIVNSFDSRFAFDATKNSVRNTLKAVSDGLFPENIATAIAHNQRNRRLLLNQFTDVNVNVDAGEALALPGDYDVQTWENTQGEKEVFVKGWDGDQFRGEDSPEWTLAASKKVKGISHPTGAHISWTADWANSPQELAQKWQGGVIDDEATVGLKGKDIFLGDVTVKGKSALIVKINPNQKVFINGLTVDNAGWEYRPLTTEQALATDNTHSEFEKMWGYKVVEKKTMVFDLTKASAGYFIVDRAGNITQVSSSVFSSSVGLEETQTDQPADAAMLIEDVPGATIATDETILNWQTPEVQKSGKKDSLEQTLDKIIKEYDIRGYDGGDNENFPAQMDEELGIWMGRGLGSLEFLSELHGKSVSLKPGDLFILAGDNGPRTPEVRRWFTEGLKDAGINVIDLGEVGSGLLYSAISRLGAKGGLYVTRSHVEVGTNGVKPNIGGITLYGEMLKKIKDMIMTGQYRKADVRGAVVGREDPRAQKAIDEYFDELRQNYGHITQLLKDHPIPIRVNMSGGSLTEMQKYKDLFGDILGDSLKGFMRGEPDQWGEEGTADPTRPDALGKIMDYSREHPEELIFNYDLDADRITVLWGGRLYKGDKMFYPILEYMLTMDPAHQQLDQSVHKGLNRTYFYDSRMSSEVRQIIELFGGIAMIHPKGHSKVKATMDQMFDLLAENEGFTGEDKVQQFLEAHPGFKLIQSEYTTHMFTTNQNGEAFDDAVLFMFSWLDMFLQVLKKHAADGSADWNLEDYITYLRTEMGIKEDHQLPESRMPIYEDAKFKVMEEMTAQVEQALNGRSDFAYASKWNWKQNVPAAKILMQNVEGVFDLSTPAGGMFWGWSNTSPKVALGASATSPEAQTAMATMVAALYIHSRTKVAEEIGVELEPIHPLETTELFGLLGLSNDVLAREGISKEEFDALDKSEQKALRAELQAKWFPVMSNEIEEHVLSAYPTMDSVLQAIADTSPADASMFTDSEKTDASQLTEKEHMLRNRLAMLHEEAVVAQDNINKAQGALDNATTKTEKHNRESTLNEAKGELDRIQREIRATEVQLSISSDKFKQSYGNQYNDRLWVLRNREVMGEAAALAGIEQMEKLLEEKERITIMFAAAPSQVDTVKALVEFSKGRIDWTRVNIVHMDEWVPENPAERIKRGDPESFRTWLDNHLINPIMEQHGIAADDLHFYPIDADNDLTPEQVAQQYAQTIESLGGIDGIFGGYGDNGHVAFNDATQGNREASMALYDKGRPIAAVVDPHSDPVNRQQQFNDYPRFKEAGRVPLAVTVTLPIMKKAKFIIMSVPGAAKQEAIKNVHSRNGTSENAEFDVFVPATYFNDSKVVQVFTDQEGAALLPGQADSAELAATADVSMLSVDAETVKIAQNIRETGWGFDPEGYGYIAFDSDGRPAPRYGQHMNAQVEKIDSFLWRLFGMDPQESDDDVIVAVNGVGGQTTCVLQADGLVVKKKNRKLVVLDSLGTDYGKLVEEWLAALRANPKTKIAWVVGSKSGQTDETMANFQNTLRALIEVHARFEFGDGEGKRIAETLISKLWNAQEFTELAAMTTEALQLTDQQKEVLQAVFKNAIFATGTWDADAQSGSRLDRMIKEGFLKDLFDDPLDQVATLEMLPNLGGRFQGISPNSLAINGLLGLDIHAMLEAGAIEAAYQRQADNYTQEIAEHIVASGMKHMIIGVPDGRFLNLAEALGQTVPESLGKGRQYGFEFGLQTFKYEGSQVNRAFAFHPAGKFYFMIDVEGEEPVALDPAIEENNFVYRFKMNGINESELARIIQFVEDLTARIGSLYVAQALREGLRNHGIEYLDLNDPKVIADIMNGSKGLGQFNAKMRGLHALYNDITPFRQPGVEGAKKLVKGGGGVQRFNSEENMQDGLPVRDAQQRAEYYGRRNAKVAAGSVLEPSALGIRNAVGDYLTGGQANAYLTQLTQGVDVEGLNNTQRQLVALINHAHRQGKAFNVVIYENREEETERVKEALEAMGVDRVDFGPAEQHKSRQLTVQGNDVAFELIIQAVRTQKKVDATESVLVADGMVPAYLHGLTPSEVRDIYADVYPGVFQGEAVQTETATLFVKDLTEVVNRTVFLDEFEGVMEAVDASQLSFHGEAGKEFQKTWRSINEALELGGSLEDVAKKLAGLVPSIRREETFVTFDKLKALMTTVAKDYPKLKVIASAVLAAINSEGKQDEDFLTLVLPAEQTKAESIATDTSMLNDDDKASIASHLKRLKLSNAQAIFEAYLAGEHGPNALEAAVKAVKNKYPHVPTDNIRQAFRGAENWLPVRGEVSVGLSDQSMLVYLENQSVGPESLASLESTNKRSMVFNVQVKGDQVRLGISRLVRQHDEIKTVPAGSASIKGLIEPYDNEALDALLLGELNREGNEEAAKDVLITFARALVGSGLWADKPLSYRDYGIRDILSRLGIENVETVRELAEVEKSTETAPVGGIDLNAKWLDLKIKRDGNGVALPLSDQPIEDLMAIDGFIPVIINVTPINNLPMILGLVSEDEKQQRAADTQPDMFSDEPKARLVEPALS